MVVVTFTRTNREYKMKQVSEATQQAIERQIILEKMRGNKTFKNVWIGNGWLSKDENGKITFTATKQMAY